MNAASNARHTNHQDQPARVRPASVNPTHTAQEILCPTCHSYGRQAGPDPSYGRGYPFEPNDFSLTELLNHYIRRPNIFKSNRYFETLLLESLLFALTQNIV